MAASPITVSTHVLDVARGAPAEGVPVELDRLDDGRHTAIAAAVTDADGRASLVADVAPALPGGRYRLTFDTAEYGAVFYPQVIIVVELAEGCGHTHIPLLLSAFGYTTYRGS